MSRLLPPSIVFQGRRWSTEALVGMAAAARRAILETGSVHAGNSSTGYLAMVMDNHPESVALLFALSSLPLPIILLPPEAGPEHAAPALPIGTRLLLLARQHVWQAAARSLEADVEVLPDLGEGVGSSEELPFMTMPGVVFFTSGSTQAPRPVYRSTSALVSVARALVHTLRLSTGGGVIACLPLARAFGFNHGLMAAAVLESPLALLARFQHDVLLRLFASGEWQYWAGTPMMADLLGRCPASEPHRAPSRCLIGGRVSRDIARRFEQRFTVPIRQGYGTTESGTIAVDADAEPRFDRTGRPLHGVHVRIGDDPRAPLPPGALGRIWLSAPGYMMDGYGFPPALDAAENIDGWWGTPDVGLLDADGSLTVSSRLDDCFRTAAGYLVNPASVVDALENYPGLDETMAVPLATPSGPVLGLLVQSVTPTSVVALRGHLARALPAWSQPRVIESTEALPRLSSGRVDRRACIALLERALLRGDPR